MSSDRRTVPATEEHDTLPRTRVRIGDIEIGGDRFVVIAGPCAVESFAQIQDAADLVAEHGAHVLRGGAFKARTSPYTFQGLGLEGLRLMRAAADAHRMPIISEVLSEHDVEAMDEFVDAFQVGSRNMDNTALLKLLGQVTKPVLLKRGFAATISEWLLAAEYVIVGGNDQVVLCERGIRTFSNETRFTLDLAGAVYARQQTRLPVVVDPSHATGNPRLIPAMAAATLASGLDGLMVEVHPDPASALSDADQALSPERYRGMMEHLRLLSTVTGRPIS
ncbi:MAG: 3-deoxy-7-phosphoheptulonate synthase [Bacteroidota bacterium]|jgi:3-deoxy-7-phosphoheptulonate synthase|nr:3-deoxy-7-phosphoheptulonate synthase [Bacteroidota bacterium]